MTGTVRKRLTSVIIIFVVASLIMTAAVSLSYCSIRPIELAGAYIIPQKPNYFQSVLNSVGLRTFQKAEVAVITPDATMEAVLYIAQQRDLEWLILDGDWKSSSVLQPIIAAQKN